MTPHKVVCTTHSDIFTAHYEVATAHKEVFTAHNKVCTAHKEVFTAHNKVCTAHKEVFIAHKVVCATHNKVVTARNEVCYYRSKKKTYDSCGVPYLQACQNLNLVKKIDSVVTGSQVPLTKADIVNDYPNVFKGLGSMDGTYHIELDETVEPVIHPPRKVPYSLLGRLQDRLKELEILDVIQKVDRPTKWVNSLVIVEKRNGSLRLCLDPRDLNRAIRREHYRIPTAEDIASRLNGKKLFSIVDEKDGFWQVNLDEESSYLCTFNTPFGRYRFKRMPFGISSAPEVFQKKNEALFGDIDGVEIIFDDIIVAAESEVEHDTIMRKLLQRAREANVKFNEAKLQFKVSEVKYMGNIVSESGLKPDDEKI